MTGQDNRVVPFSEVRTALLVLIKHARANDVEKYTPVFFDLLEKINTLWVNRQELARQVADTHDELESVREEFADFAINENEHAIDQRAKEVAADKLVEALDGIALDNPAVFAALDDYKNEIARIEAV